MEEDKDQVKPTIVGARPPEDIILNISSPGGVQVLLYKAKADHEFRKELISRRSSSAVLVGISLDVTEAAMLDSIPLQQLECMIDAIRLPDEKLKMIKKCTAAALIAAAGLIPALAAGGCSHKRDLTGPEDLHLQTTNTPTNTMISTPSETSFVPAATFTGTNTPTNSPTVSTPTNTPTNTFLPGTPSHTYTATYSATSTSTTAGILSTPTYTYTQTRTSTSTPAITP